MSATAGPDREPGRNSTNESISDLRRIAFASDLFFATLVGVLAFAFGAIYLPFANAVVLLFGILLRDVLYWRLARTQRAVFHLLFCELVAATFAWYILGLSLCFFIDASRSTAWSEGGFVAEFILASIAAGAVLFVLRGPHAWSVDVQSGRIDLEAGVFRPSVDPSGRGYNQPRLRWVAATSMIGPVSVSSYLLLSRFADLTSTSIGSVVGAILAWLLAFVIVVWGLWDANWVVRILVWEARTGRKMLIETEHGRAGQIPI